MRQVHKELLKPESPDVETLEADDSEELRHFHWRIGKNLTRRLDQYLVDRVGYLSRAGVQRVIGEGLVKVNGRVAKASYHPREGDEVEMAAPPEPVNEIVPEPIPLEVIYEDDYLMAINKQAGLIVHPARGVWTGTLVNGLVHYGKQWSTINGEWRPGILHRLDRNTTGVMLVAKSDEAHWRVARQFENRTIQKTYLAVCHGVPPLLGDVIDMPIGPDRYIREKQAVRKEANGGKPAVTLFQTQETFGTAGGERFCFLKLMPKTGRTHQLRVHMSYTGHPLVGDTIYGGRPFVRGEFRFERQALHAYEITFVHPITLKPMTIQAPVAADMQGLLDTLRSSP
jgi:23S rRNA pseudouridine1911/1915/1917 synthase